MFLRIGRSSWTVLLSRCLGTGGLSVPKAIRNVNLTAPKRRELSCYPNEVFLLRNCSTSPAKMNCWNCKQLLEDVPAFFCKSCKVIQPPEEGASYFKILDCDYTFSLDAQKLQRRYLQLQRSLHPDNSTQEATSQVQMYHANVLWQEDRCLYCCCSPSFATQTKIVLIVD
ncbi:hypothetical protein OJAV_G00085840 [Oryzias javanicus]|uniref:J domain-containing protein n=1 Tax=Oryzias javanicus TaxID=123683 RepID=A0A437CYP4_ORYJA|nr:hypothetical protein OJAV_G00085840 [Oryzias javanicus]